MTNQTQDHRRNFLKFLLASPLIRLPGIAGAQQDATLDPDLEYILNMKKQLISDPEAALSVFDFEAVAREILPPAHYGYLATGVTDESSQLANRQAYNNIRLTSRRLKDVNDIDTSVTIFGRKWPTPICLAPTSGHRAFHDDGELAVAAAAKEKERLMIISNLASYPIEDVVEARGEPIWFQLYARSHWPSALHMIKRAEAAGCPAVVLTVDLIGAGRRETLERFIRRDTRDCVACHGEERSPYRGRPMMDGFEFKDYWESPRIFDGDFLKKIRDSSSMKLVIKGITHPDDAEYAIENGAQGIMVSNHGGRGQVSARGTIEVLPDIVKAVNGRVPVLVDGGIRRGSDIYKALALGADAIDIGRPYLWGLGAFGQPGVEKVLDILDQELKSVMQQMGTTSIDQIKPDSLVIPGTGF